MQVDKRLDVYVGMQEVIKRWATWPQMLPSSLPSLSLSLLFLSFLISSSLWRSVEAAKLVVPGGSLKSPKYERCC